MSTLPRTKHSLTSQNDELDFRFGEPIEHFVMSKDNKPKKTPPKKKKHSSSSSYVQVPQTAVATSVTTGQFLSGFSTLCTNLLCFKRTPPTPVEIPETEFESRVEQILNDKVRSNENKFRDALQVRKEQEAHALEKATKAKTSLDTYIDVKAPEQVQQQAFATWRKAEVEHRRARERRMALEGTYDNIQSSKEIVSSTQLTRLSTTLMNNNIKASGGVDAITTSVVDAEEAQKQVEALSDILHHSSPSYSSGITESESIDLSFQAYLHDRKMASTTIPSSSASPYTYTSSLPSVPFASLPLSTPEGTPVEPLSLLN